MMMSYIRFFYLYFTTTSFSVVFIVIFLQDRLTVSPEAYPSLSVAISKIYKDGGIGAFYAGISPTLIGMLPYSTCYYFMYETLKTSYCQSKNKKSLNRPEMLLLGAFAGENMASIMSFILFYYFKKRMTSIVSFGIYEKYLLVFFQYMYKSLKQAHSIILDKGNGNLTSSLPSP